MSVSPAVGVHYDSIWLWRMGRTMVRGRRILLWLWTGYDPDWMLAAKGQKNIGHIQALGFVYCNSNVV